MILEHDSLDPNPDEIQKTNEIYLAGFRKWLVSKGLSKKTISTHISNVDFYINEYLCYYDALDASHGCYDIGGFLGDWFIRKAMWASCAQIKSNAVSIKKFYTYLLEEGVVNQDDYDNLCDTIKDDMQEWLDRIKRYDDLAYEDWY
jgi:site-specific recombinase XerD